MPSSKNNEFINQDIVTDFVKNIINSKIKKRNLSFSREVFHPSNITECERRIMYRVYGEKPEIEESTLAILESINKESDKNKWVSFFENCGKAKLIEKDFVSADCNYNLTGKIDAILQIKNLILVLAVKTLASSDFSNIEKNGALRKHVIEIMLNMWMAEIKDGILLYENGDTNEFCLYHVVPYDPILTACQKKCSKLLMFKMKGDLPDRQYKNNNSKECCICEFKSKCWKKVEV